MAFASAAEYHVPATGAFGKSRFTYTGPAAPSTPEVALHGSDWKLAATRTSTSLLSTAPHRSAANW
jgi:hypothetical protein